MRGLRPSVLAVAALAAVSVPGCGGDGGSASGDAALTSCASRWNSERAAVFGTHAYAEHGSQRALVTTLPVGGSDSCAVIFAVSDDDSEHGTVGEVATLQGWVPMQQAGPDPAALQRRGSAEANASVAPDGTVELQ